MKKLKILFVPSCVAINVYDDDVLINYEKLSTTLSIEEVLKYHLFNVRAVSELKEFSMNMEPYCLSAQNVAFISKHQKQYEIVCKRYKDGDSYFNMSGLIQFSHLLSYDLVIAKILEGGDPSKNSENFLNTICEGYGTDTMMQYLNHKLIKS